MSSRQKGQLGLLVVAIIWGSGFVMSSIALDYYAPIHILALRFTIAFISMCLLSYKKLKQVKKSTLVKGSALGVILYLAFYFQTVGLVYTTPSKNAFLTAVNVVLVPIIGMVFLRKKMSGLSILGAVSAIIGVALMSLNEFNQINIGDILTLICALFFALQIIFTSLYVKDEDPFVLNTVQMGVAALSALVVAFISKETFIIAEFEGNIAVLYLGVVSTMVAFLLQTSSQKFTTETETAIILSLESVFGMLFSALLIGEDISVRMVLGATLILLGVLIVQIKPKRNSLP